MIDKRPPMIVEVLCGTWIRSDKYVEILGYGVTSNISIGGVGHCEILGDQAAIQVLHRCH